MVKANLFLISVADKEIPSWCLGRPTRCTCISLESILASNSSSRTVISSWTTRIFSQGMRSDLSVNWLHPTSVTSACNCLGQLFLSAAFLSESSSHLIRTLVKTYFMGNNNGVMLFLDDKEPHAVWKDSGEAQTKISHWIKSSSVFL